MIVTKTAVKLAVGDNSCRHDVIDHQRTVGRTSAAGRSTVLLVVDNLFVIPLRLPALRQHVRFIIGTDNNLNVLLNPLGRSVRRTSVWLGFLFLLRPVGWGGEGGVGERARKGRGKPRLRDRKARKLTLT